MLMMSFLPKSEDAKKVMPNQKIKIKFEIDTDNPSGGTTEYRYKMLPAPYEVQIFDEPTLFAGKIHAIICREYKNHVKGRDYHDYLFYIGKGSKFNLQYLENKLKNTGGIIDEYRSEITPFKIIEALRQMNITKLESENNDEIYVPSFKRTHLTDALGEIFNMSFAQRAILGKRLNKLI